MKNPHYQSIPTWGRNLLALSFAIWCAVAGALLATGETAPAIRLAFAVCGTAFIAVVGAALGGTVTAARTIYRYARSPRVWCWALAIGVLSAIGCVFFAVFTQASRYAQGPYTSGILKIEGYALVQYARDHDDTLPPDTHSRAVGNYLRPYCGGEEYHSEIKHGFPVVWCGAVSGLRRSDVAEPFRTLAAYAPVPHYGGDYVMLFLDGHVKSFYATDFRRILREQPALIAEAERARAKRQSHGPAQTAKPAVK